MFAPLPRIAGVCQGMSLAAQPFAMDSYPGSIDTRDLVSVCRVGEGLDRALLREMLGYFIDENQRRMARSAEAVETGNRETLRQVAHAVRGSAAMLRAGRLHDLAWGLELDAVTSDIPQLRLSLDALRTELDAVVTSLYRVHPEAWND